MGKKEKKKRSFTLPMALIAPVAASLFTAGKRGWGGSPISEAMAGNYQNAAHHLLVGWTGIDTLGNFDPINGMQYTKMTLIGAAVHWVASKLGVNRALGRARVPIIRI